MVNSNSIWEHPRKSNSAPNALMSAIGQGLMQGFMGGAPNSATQESTNSIGAALSAQDSPMLAILEKLSEALSTLSANYQAIAQAQLAQSQISLEMNQKGAQADLHLKEMQAIEVQERINLIKLQQMDLLKKSEILETIPPSPLSPSSSSPVTQ